MYSATKPLWLYSIQLQTSAAFLKQGVEKKGGLGVSLNELSIL